MRWRNKKSEHFIFDAVFQVHWLSVYKTESYFDCMFENCFRLYNIWLAINEVCCRIIVKSWSLHDQNWRVIVSTRFTCIKFYKVLFILNSILWINIWYIFIFFPSGKKGMVPRNKILRKIESESKSGKLSVTFQYGLKKVCIMSITALLFCIFPD